MARVVNSSICLRHRFSKTRVAITHRGKRKASHNATFHTRLLPPHKSTLAQSSRNKPCLGQLRAHELEAE